MIRRLQLVALFFAFVVAAILLFTMVARGQRTAPTWIGPGAPPGVNTPQSTLFPPNILASWTVSQWYVDPANSTGCASDSNATCTTNTCGTAGDGPCRTFTQIATRWTTYAPRLRQNTTITFLSSQSGTADPVVLYPQYENGSIEVALVGPLGASQQACTGTLAGVVSKNRATPQLLNATLCAGLTPGVFVVNNTHPSKAFTYSLISGTTWALTQPLTSATFGVSFASEVDTWANGDSYTAYNLVGVNLVAFVPTSADLGASPNDTGLVQNIKLLDPGGSGLNWATMGTPVDIFECFAQRDIYAVAPDQMTPFVSYYSNVFAQSGISGGSTYLPGSAGFAVHPTVFGGAMGSPGAPTLVADKLAGISLDDDVILKQTFASTPVGIGSARLGLVYVDSSSVATCSGTCNAFSGGTASGSVIVWGPGTLNVAGSGRVTYPSGAGAAAAAFKAPLQSNGQTLGCITKPSSSTITCNTTVSAANLDTNLGATSGCIGPMGGGTFCNYGP